MKTLKVDLSQDTVKEFTESNVLVSNLQFMNTEAKEVMSVSSLDTKASCQRFTAKALKTLKILAQFKNCYWLQNVVSVKGESLFIVNMVRTSENEFLFETFKKLGIIITELKIGYSLENNKIYLTNKMLRDLSRFSGDILTQITMYIVSLAYFFINFTLCDNCNLSYEPFADSLTLDYKIYTNLENFIYTFNKEINIFEICEFITDDLVSITNYKTAYSKMTLLNVGTFIGTYTLLKSTDSSDTKESILYTQGAKSFNPLVLRIIKNGILSNLPLNFLDLANDTLISHICNVLDTTCKIVYKENLGLQDTQKHMLFTDIEEFVNKDTLNKVIELFIKTHIEDAFNVKEAESLLKIKFDASKGNIDCETMKELYKDDEYAQQLYLQVQDYYDTFNLKDLTQSVKGFAKGAIYSMMFTGESGTGKSTAAKVIPSRCGFPFISINFSANVEESDLFGSMIPNAEKKNPEDPEFIWQDGIITRSVRKGYTVILEEINFARPGVLGKLNSLLDESRQIDLPTGEIVKAHPNFRIIATCNIAYEGTNRFNKALINRFEVVKKFEDLTKEEIVNIIINRTGYSNRANIDKIYNVYEAIKKYAKEQNLRIVVSLRQLLTLFKQGKYYKNAFDAVKILMINGAFIEESEYQDNFEKTILKAFDLSFKI